MLLKLIKYDFKATYLKMLSTFALYFIIAVVVPFIIYPFNKNAASIYISLATIIGTFAFAAVITIFIFQHFNSNIYGSEGYLMSTLPTNGYMLLLSKFITAFIWNAIALLIEILSAFSLMTLFYWTIPSVAKFVNGFPHSPYFFDIIGNIAQILFAAIISSITFYMTVYLSIAVSKLPIFRKFGTLMGVVTFFVVSFIESIPANVIDSFRNRTYNYNITSANEFLVMLANNNFFSNIWYSSLIDLAFGVLLFFITGWLIDKKMSLK